MVTLPSVFSFLCLTRRRRCPEGVARWKTQGTLLGEGKRLQPKRFPCWGAVWPGAGAGDNPRSHRASNRPNKMIKDSDALCQIESEAPVRVQRPRGHGSHAQFSTARYVFCRFGLLNDWQSLAIPHVALDIHGSRSRRDGGDGNAVSGFRRKGRLKTRISP